MSITQIKTICIADILALLPIVITVYLLYFLYNLGVSKASPIVKKIAHQCNLEIINLDKYLSIKELVKDK